MLRKGFLPKSWTLLPWSRAGRAEEEAALNETMCPVCSKGTWLMKVCFIFNGSGPGKLLFGLFMNILSVLPCAQPVSLRTAKHSDEESGVFLQGFTDSMGSSLMCRQHAS